jgi:ATP-binding cassette subfamily F protein uup
LLNLLQGSLTPDSGQFQQINGLRVAGLMQDVPLDAKEESVYHFLVKSLGAVGELLDRFKQLSSDAKDLDALARCQQQMDDKQAWDILPRVDMMASRLGLDTEAKMHSLSGGMKRRVLLAAALIAAPDLLLLDEPTNHLDLNGIEWLEAYLKTYTGSLLLVTHDREFLDQVANQIVEIDRGKLYNYACNYETYLDRREARRLSEEKQSDLFDKRLGQEEAWLRQGVKARRTRNEGRVRALKAMREQYRVRREEQGRVQDLNLNVKRSGALVLEVDKLNYSLADRALIKDFSLLMMRGDKLGIIGPNGCGKTTLVRLLLGELTADSGNLHRGTSLEIAYFDQLRRQLDEEGTVMANVGDGADYVTINGKQKHVASYLREFLFPKERFNQLVSNLSGGERNRLLLAKLFAKPVNFLVMDEPTNDLDIETLELLESMLIDYPGTLIVISHDRAFLNQVVTSVLVYEGEGQFNEYLSYEEYRAQKKQEGQRGQAAVAKPLKTAGTSKLSYNEQRELTQLPLQIEKLEQKIAALQLKMADPDFYQQEAQTMASANQALAKEEEALKKLYARWEALEAQPPS